MFRFYFYQSFRQYYGAELENLNFIEDPEGSREVINKWVESQTNDKIKELLPKDSINEDTALVLVNAIYFKVSSSLAPDLWRKGLRACSSL